VNGQTERATRAYACCAVAAMEPIRAPALPAGDWSDFLPAEEVERVAPNEEIGQVQFGMAALATAAAEGTSVLGEALDALPPRSVSGWKAYCRCGAVWVDRDCVDCDA
jgi:hypothetical protein